MNLTRYLRISAVNKTNESVTVELIDDTTVNTDQQKKNPFEKITSSVGTINLNGQSTLQRSCSLTLHIPKEDAEGQEYYVPDWAIKTQFKIETCMKLDDTEPSDMDWQSQGIYVITSFSKSESVQSYTLSLSGKDKMCLLNGDLGGHFGAQIDFGTIETEKDDGSIIIDHIPVKTIINNLLCVYGNEKKQNIAINDIPEVGYELWEYVGREPLYLFYDTIDKKVINMTLDQNYQLVPCVIDEETGNVTTLPNININNSDIIYRTNQKLLLKSNENSTKFKWGSKIIEVIRILQDEVAGYHQTSLVYAGELIADATNTVTNILDKIVQMLGEYEYFYDVDGKFIFQKKHTYITDGNTPITYAAEFANKELITQITDNVAINQVKNDFTIWATRASDQLPIHARIAIDKKPAATNGDWRETIYQEAKTWITQGNEDSDQEIAPSRYADYYTDLYSFWRQLYCPVDSKGLIETERLDGIEYDPTTGWNTQVYNSPENLLFWFDFIEPEKGSAFKKIDIDTIGRRKKVVKQNQHASIYTAEVPEVLYWLQDETLPKSTAYSPLFIPDDLKYKFILSNQGVSVLQQLDNLIMNNATMAETINLTIIPNYNIQPNTRIKYFNQDYIVKSVTIPTTYNGLMQLTLEKVNPFV